MIHKIFFYDENNVIFGIKETQYKYYQVGDNIIYQARGFVVRNTVIDEDGNQKTISAYNF